MQDLEDFFTIEGITNELTTSEAVVMIGTAFLLCSVIAFLYRATHSGINYRQSTAQTIILLGMLVAVIMAVIGSNVASAFTLVGAMSIIRFRNAVRQTRDVGFIFFAMAIGMATGTRFYALALIATAGVGLAIVLMHQLRLFRPTQRSHTISVRVPSDSDPTNSFDELFTQYGVAAELRSLASKEDGTMHEVEFVATMPIATSLVDLSKAMMSLGGSRVSFGATNDRMSL